MAYNPRKHQRRSVRRPGYDYTQPGTYFITICTHDRACLFGDVVEGVMRLSEYGRMVHQQWKAMPRHFARVALDAFVVMPDHVHGLIVITSEEDEGRGGHDIGDISGSDDAHNRDDAGDGGTHRGEASVVQATDVPIAKHENTVQAVPDEADASPLWVPPHGVLMPPSTSQTRPPLPFEQLFRHTPMLRAGGTLSGSLGAVIQNVKSTTTRKINRRRRTPRAPVWQRGYYDHIVRGRDALGRIRRYIIENPLWWKADRSFLERLKRSPQKGAEGTKIEPDG